MLNQSDFTTLQGTEIKVMQTTMTAEALTNPNTYIADKIKLLKK